MRKQPQGSRSQVVRALPSSPMDRRDITPIDPRDDLVSAGRNFVQALTLEVHQLRGQVGQLQARLTVEITGRTVAELALNKRLASVEAALKTAAPGLGPPVNASWLMLRGNEQGILEAPTAAPPSRP